MTYKLKSLIFLIIMSSTIFAGTTGKITGRITDAQTGEPVPFVNIIIMETNLGAASDIDGYFSILNIPPGTYVVKASAIGYNSVSMQNVKVSIDLTTSIDFKLSTESIELGEEVVVVATKPLIQKDMTSSTAIVGDELISELPVTDISDVLSLQSGIVVSSDGGLHLRGGRSGQVTYQIDGVPVTDSYDGSTIVDVNSSAVQELQVISGAFNAEYGQALSGVINLVTKDGNNDYHGSFQSYIGDYVSSNEDIFWDIKDLNPVAIRNFEGSLSGPVINDQIYLFTNFRYLYNDGYIYGRRTYLPTDISFELQDTGGNEYFITQNGDGKYVSMNWSKNYFGQGKLTYVAFPGLKLSYNFLYDKRDYQEYDHDSYNLLTPDNNLQKFETSNSNIFAINHAVSDNSFYTLNLSYNYKDFHQYLYEDIYTGDPNNPTLYVDNDLRQRPAHNFAVGGTNDSRFTRNSGTIAAKLDWVTQANKEINLQFGGEFKKNRLFLQDITLAPMLNENGQRANPYNVVIPPQTSLDNDKYIHNPMEGAAYVQAKFEAFSIIFNAGVRFDVFDPDGKILTDPSDPNIVNPLKPDNRFNDTNGNGVLDNGETVKTVADREAYWYKDATIKTQLSPRLGLAFPISAFGVIHFSYGHFFQLPRYQYLYENPEFEIADGSGNVGLMGNADLRPQKTVKGEIGLQQQLSDDMAVDMTLFFEDFRDLSGTQNAEILVFGGDKTYSKYQNSDFGFSRGFIIKFTKRFGGGFATNIDYTYSETKGNASNPADARNAITGGAIPETFIAPLDWDQTHTLNLSAAYTKMNDYGFSIIGNFYSGQPYTPQVNKNTRITKNGFQRNSDIKPSQFKIDMRVYKDIMLMDDLKLTIFAKVFNLLDAKNPVNIYGDSGDPYFSFEKLEAEKINPVLYNNTLNEFYTNASFFSEPRRVELGVSFNF
ncbi:MAG: TonB-dependent receptor [Ignavibacteriales bacterium]|nr:TonB-dependent receptor [Ignavibacteriales bacterium]